MYWCVIQNDYMICEVSTDYIYLMQEWNPKTDYDNISGDIYLLQCTEEVYHIVNIYGGNILYGVNESNIVNVDYLKWQYTNWDMTADYDDLVLLYPVFNEETQTYHIKADNGDDVNIGDYKDLNELLNDVYRSYQHGSTWYPYITEYGIVINCKMEMN